MKNKLEVVILITLCFSFQVGFTQTSQQLDINNINARINIKGLLFNDPVNSKPGFEAPKTSGIHSIFAANLWMGNSTKLAASMYSIDSTDYSNGPLTSFGATSSGVQNQCNKVWKVSKAEIDYHIAVKTGAIIDPGYIIPQSISDWPANGFVYGGDYDWNLAPYIDVNSDNMYTPSLGDYPKIKGDMATYVIYNDYSTTSHQLSGGQPLKVEIHQMAYAFGCTSNAALDNTIFVEYKIINKSTSTYSNFYFGLWADIDLGDYSNDYIGCDVNRSCYFQYNSNGTDVTNGSTLGYGNYHPTQGVVILSGPWMDGDGIDNNKIWDGSPNIWSPNGLGFDDGIIDNERWGMTSFMHNHNNGGAWNSNPTTAAQYHNVMRSYWADYSYLRYGGAGHASNYDYDDPSKFVYPGASDPTRYGTSGWSYPAWDAITAGQSAEDEKGVGGIGPITFGPGHVQRIEAAYVFAQNTNVTGVQAGKDLFFQYVDEIKDMYTNGNFYCTTTDIEQIDDKSNISIFPNPVENRLYINEINEEEIQAIKLLTIEGRVVLEFRRNERILDLEQLKAGIYFIQITTTSNKIIRKIIKN